MCFSSQALPEADVLSSSVVAYHPAPDPTSTGKWPDSAWFVLIEMPGAQELLQEFSPTVGIMYDDKEQVSLEQVSVIMIFPKTCTCVNPMCRQSIHI